MRWWFLICFCFLLLLLCCDSINFNRTFKLKRQKKPSRNKNVTSILRKGLKKFMNISQVPTLPPIPTLSPRKAIVDKNNEEYNPCKVVDLCSNGGKCRTKSNEYYCECKPEYYGKTCQFYADPSYCGNHQCQNNGTCYSIDKPITVQNSKYLGAPLTDEEKKTVLKNASMTVEIRYQCWCKDGFYGTFCEFSEEMRHCVEESCHGHGYVETGIKNFECKCICDDYYLGEKCETISPCRDLECTNNGTCIITSEGEPKCECPESAKFHLLKAEVKGDLCETIQINDSVITSGCMPCTGNFRHWIECLEDHDIIHSELEFLWKRCQEHDPECYSKLEGKDCFNGGNCSVIVDSFPENFRFKNKVFLVPKCYCPEDYYGDFCEHYNTRNPCEEAAKNGFKCNGTCLFSEANGLQCTCDYGMKGPTCEIVDPCIPNPCEDSSTICVEIPDATNTPSYSCICGLNQDVNPKSMACITPHHEICTTSKGEPTCRNNGHCYPCALDENEKISLCRKDETGRGFRCICPPGFMPPFCDHEVDACSFHQCQNGAQCIPKEGTLADYDCKCRPDYNGTFCEQSPSICKTQGFTVCVHGSCEEDVTNVRGFTCKCEERFYGDNCENEEEWNFFNEIDKRYWWTYPLLLSMILLPFTLIVLWFKRKRRLAAAESAVAAEQNLTEAAVPEQQNP